MAFILPILDTDVEGILDMDLDGNGAPTPEVPGSDSVSVPEPSIIALFAAGLFGLGFARRRRA